VLSGAFTAEEDNEVGDKGSGDATMVDVHTLLVAWLNMSLRYDCFTEDFFFLVKCTEEYFPQLPDYQKCWIIR
jgi:hypothetical protein